MRGELARDGFAILRGLLDRERADRLRAVADGLRERYARHDPVSGLRGFLHSPWSIAHVEHPGFYTDAPDWWFPELMGLVADPAIHERWRTATGDEPAFASAALFVDPIVPLPADLRASSAAAADGAGRWHRDTAENRTDEREREELLGGRLDEAGHIIEVALVPSDSFEYVPGSHARWDTPLELEARKHGTTLAARTQPLPGARRIVLGAGDAVLVDTRGIHRGWYRSAVPRRTAVLWYLSAARLERHPGEEQNLCLLDSAQIDRLPTRLRPFFQREPAVRSR
ncbi:MAG TPA: phytanoyl-CoA dioxygenase family protein [Candidatus Dormibacteraeota bacterium]|nr:phytanoyl-CoA dioxygenase family protein [Candidatus Dormibacteraeota bacterium]